MNDWEKIIEFFNTYQKSTREQMYNYMGRKRGNNLTTIDTYRNNLNKAGFIDVVDRGMYKRVKKIPTDLTISKCLLLIEANRNANQEVKKVVKKRPKNIIVGKSQSLTFQDRLDSI